MSYSIITISRQFGAGGRPIAAALAKTLGVPVHDSDIPVLTAEKCGLPKDYVERKSELASGHFFASFLSKRDMNGHSDQDDVWNAQAEVIWELAGKGPCIFVGKSADYILKDRQDVLSVFLCASKEYRAERLRGSEYLEAGGDPVKYIRERDKKRAMHCEFYTGRKWDDPRNYHMVLDVSRLGETSCVELIAKAYGK